jgi:DNA-binding response OmpR family regulator
LAARSPFGRYTNYMKPGLDILLIEDNDALAANIADYLEARGHRMDFASDGAVGLALAISTNPDVILLDVALPKMDGLSLCEQLRRDAPRHIPVLMLTARDTLDDKLAGFAHGADDYLVKPFALAELAARIDALSMRHRLGTDHKISIGSLVLNRQQQCASRNGRELRLSPILWSILLVLAETYPRPISRSELTKRLWGDDPPPSDALRSHIHLLRQTLDKPFTDIMLETVHGVGFRLVADI